MLCNCVPVASITAKTLLLECKSIPAYSSKVASCGWVAFESLVASEGTASGRRRHEFQVLFLGGLDGVGQKHRALGGDGALGRAVRPLRMARIPGAAQTRSSRRRACQLTRQVECRLIRVYKGGLWFGRVAFRRFLWCSCVECRYEPRSEAGTLAERFGTVAPHRGAQCECRIC